MGACGAGIRVDCLHNRRCARCIAAAGLATTFWWAVPRKNLLGGIGAGPFIRRGDIRILGIRSASTDLCRRKAHITTVGCQTVASHGFCSAVIGGTRGTRDKGGETSRCTHRLVSGFCTVACSSATFERYGNTARIAQAGEVAVQSSATGTDT